MHIHAYVCVTSFLFHSFFFLIHQTYFSSSSFPDTAASFNYFKLYCIFTDLYFFLQFVTFSSTAWPFLKELMIQEVFPLGMISSMEVLCVQHLHISFVYILELQFWVSTNSCYLLLAVCKKISCSQRYLFTWIYSLITDSSRFTFDTHGMIWSAEGKTNFSLARCNNKMTITGARAIPNLILFIGHHKPLVAVIRTYKKDQWRTCRIRQEKQ